MMMVMVMMVMVRGAFGFGFGLDVMVVAGKEVGGKVIGIFKLWGEKLL